MLGIIIIKHRHSILLISMYLLIMFDVINLLNLLLFMNENFAIDEVLSHDEYISQI